MNKTLGEIINSIHQGEKPDYEDLIHTVCAMSALMVFDNQALLNLAQAEINHLKPHMAASATWQFTECFDRKEKAMAMPPKQFVEWCNNPENLEFLKIRALNP